MAPTNTFVRAGTDWVPVGPVAQLPPPDPGPGTDPPPQPATIAGGWELPPTSLEALDVIGPRGTLTPWTGSTRLSGTQVIEGKTLTGDWKPAPGAHITFVNCRLTSPLAISKYLVDVTATSGGTRVDFESCELICRAGSKSSRPIAGWGDYFMSARRTIFRGGIDGMFVKPQPSAVRPYVTGDPLVGNANVLVEECWIGDIERIDTSHSDCIQVEAGNYMVFRRNRLGSFNIPRGTDALTTRTNPLTSELAGGGFLITQDSGAPTAISYIAIRDNHLDGGNVTCDAAPPDGIPVTNVACTGNRFGLRRNHGPLRLPAGAVNSNNTWAVSGIATIGSNGQTAAVTAGQLLPGSA